MTFNVKIKKTGKKFYVKQNEEILFAALRQNIFLPYGCKNGICGLCKGYIISGKILEKPCSLPILSSDDKLLGMTLLCKAIPLTDLEIDINEIITVSNKNIKSKSCHVISIDHKSSNIIILKLRLLGKSNFKYTAGQYINIYLKDGSKRSYSIANFPNDQNFLELHIRHMLGGKFTDYVFTKMKKMDILNFEGPLGDFILQEKINKEIIFIASGTGFAPIKAIIEDILFKDKFKKVILYWGGEKLEDLYFMQFITNLKQEAPNFYFIPVLSDPNKSDNWKGRIGNVHEVVAEDFPNLSNYQVYASGSPKMIKLARNNLINLNKLPFSEFYSDPFTSLADTNKT